MRHIFSTVIMTVACLSAFVRASAQQSVKATIPFNFSVDGHWLPAGSYTILRTRENMIQFRNWEKKASASLPVYLADDHDRDDTKLAFIKYGDRYFFTELQGGFGANTLKVYTSKTEKRARMQEALLAKEQKTLVAAK